MDALNPLQTGQITESMANGKAKQVENLTRRGELLKGQSGV